MKQTIEYIIDRYMAEYYLNVFKDLKQKFLKTYKGYIISMKVSFVEPDRLKIEYEFAN